jgi:hypothetical protein
MVLAGAVHGWDPAFAAPDPDLGLGLQVERRVVEAPEADLDERVSGSGGFRMREPQRGQKPRPS